MFLKYWGFCHSKRTSSCQYKTRIEELCHQFSLADISKSTNNFDQNRLINFEGFGIEVYKGCLQHDGSDYAVTIKRFNDDVDERGEQWNVFKNEIELLCQLRHPNIISLTGFCNHKKEKIVVLEYMPNGSLYDHLQRGELSWKKRLEICIGAARGLHYLHAGAKRTIIHRDIKPQNILLDANMEPKLSNFGLSLQGQRFMSKPKPIKEFLEKPLEENIDLEIKGKIVPECWKVFIDIMQRCVDSEAEERPTMGEVEVQLQKSTNNFDRKRFIDLDGFGTNVYKGCLQHDDSDYTVIIKRCNKDAIGRREREWDLLKNEIELLCQLRHPNIISLIGFCNHKKEKIVVYEYTSNGSLCSHLQRGELSWKKRLEICIGVARGLHYLHAGAKRTIVHRNIHPRNILLDANMEPKLSEFNLSLQGQRFMSKPKPIIVDTVPEEFLEKPVEENIDLEIKGKIVPECWKVFIDIMQRCVDYEAEERPTMGEVEVQLDPTRTSHEEYAPK
ncbi:hypothetical protein ACSQ67_023192 [Phaseolus vulgaris]